VVMAVAIWSSGMSLADGVLVCAPVDAKLLEVFGGGRGWWRRDDVVMLIWGFVV